MQKTVAAVKVGDRFGLRAFPGKAFRVSSSYDSDYYGGTVYVVQIQNDDGTWSDFTKGTAGELSAERI